MYHFSYSILLDLYWKLGWIHVIPDLHKHPYHISVLKLNGFAETIVSRGVSSNNYAETGVKIRFNLRGGISTQGP